MPFCGELIVPSDLVAPGKVIQLLKPQSFQYPSYARGNI